ncbi:MAG TPA: hypothetical protein VMJ75_03960 [Candidatus Acidoferrales bacterium]|nr:hypothetical protein [Candidatus Acidoferrales bacterium]
MGPLLDTYQAATLQHIARPGAASRREEHEPLPIWLAVLLATSCEARSDSTNHTIRWDHRAGRATYTNAGSEDERIEPLGVRLSRGETLAVSWGPGETSYTLEVFVQ